MLLASRRTFFSLLLCLCSSLAAEEAPWLTGPLIAPVGQVVPYGHFLLKSYLSLNVEKRAPLESSFYSFNYQGQYFFGITSFADLQLVPRIFYNCTSNQQSVQLGDFAVGLDVQLLEPEKTPYFPGIKFAIRETFPTGPYQYLTARKWGTDQTGQGTFATQFDLIFYRLFHLHKLHWLSLTFSTSYTVNTPVSVHDFNAYGGGFGTKGVVLPGDLFETILSFECTLNRYLALALDTVYRFNQASRFYGIDGINFEGTLAKTGTSSKSQFNLAPSLEINWSSHFGIIAGCYFSVWDSENRPFRSAVCNLNYAY